MFFEHFKALGPLVCHDLKDQKVIHKLRDVYMYVIYVIWFFVH